MIDIYTLANDQAELESVKKILELDQKIKNLLTLEDNKKHKDQLIKYHQDIIAFQTPVMKMFAADMIRLQTLTFRPDPQDFIYAFPTVLYDEDVELARRSPVWHDLFKDYYMENVGRRLDCKELASIDDFVSSYLINKDPDSVEYLFLKAYKVVVYYESNPELFLAI